MSGAERIRDMIFELGDVKNKARTFEEYNLADESMRALREQYERFCKKPVIFKEVKP